MNYIKELRINGYKKFKNIVIPFNEEKNIIIGENEAGKSSVLEAISIVINQKYKNSDKSYLKDLFNRENVEYFKKNPTVNNLPFIRIELEFCLDKTNPNAFEFYGENNALNQLQYGITFLCKFNEDFAAELFDVISEGKIPYEYYNLTWIAFSGNSYSMLKKPFEFLSIDTSSNDTTSSFNYYNKSLFLSKFDDKTKMNARNTFRIELENIIDEKLQLEKIDENRSFGIDTKKVVLESVLNVIDNNIPLENKGSGMENLIKTEIAMSKKGKIDVLSIEEPENHLSYSNMQKMLFNIATNSNAQMIVTTHNDMIASRLSLNNVMWINGDNVAKLNKLDKNVALFFEKLESNNLLHFILSTKVILVEGPTEYLLIPWLYEKYTGRSVEKDGISVISCNGVSYKNYIKIAEFLNKKVSIVTDNDKSKERIKESIDLNNENKFVKIYLDSDINNWTWEVCIYNANKEKIDDIIEVNDKYEYLIKGEKPDTKVLGWMINNKTDAAYKMLTYKDDKGKGLELEIPEYVKKAIEWVK